MALAGVLVESYWQERQANAQSQGRRRAGRRTKGGQRAKTLWSQRGAQAPASNLGLVD